MVHPASDGICMGIPVMRIKFLNIENDLLMQPIRISDDIISGCNQNKEDYLLKGSKNG